jgi:hypothetical protein
MNNVPGILIRHVACREIRPIIVVSKAGLCL